jgi:hypothetical protein
MKVGEKTPTQLGLLERPNLNQWTNPGPWKTPYKHPTRCFPRTGVCPVIEISSPQGAQLSKCLLPHFYLRTETDPVSETLYFLEYRRMEKSRKFL